MFKRLTSKRNLENLIDINLNQKVKDGPIGFLKKDSDSRKINIDFSFSKNFNYDSNHFRHGPDSRMTKKLYENPDIQSSRNPVKVFDCWNQDTSVVNIGDYSQNNSEVPADD